MGCFFEIAQNNQTFFFKVDKFDEITFDSPILDVMDFEISGVKGSTFKTLTTAQIENMLDEYIDQVKSVVPVNSSLKLLYKIHNARTG